MQTDNMIPCGVHYNEDGSTGQIFWDPDTNDIKLFLNGNASVLHGLECTKAQSMTEEQLGGTLAALSADGSSNAWGVFSGDGGLFVLTGDDEDGKGYFYKGTAEKGPVGEYPYSVYEA